MIFLFPWDMLLPWRVNFWPLCVGRGKKWTLQISTCFFPEVSLHPEQFRIREGKIWHNSGFPHLSKTPRRCNTYVYIYIHIYLYLDNMYTYVYHGYPNKKNSWMTLLPSLKLTVRPENMPFQKETIVFQPSIFRCYVIFREGSPIQMNWSSLAGVFKVHNFESNTPKRNSDVQEAG